jgi:hypothetical protein
MPEGAIYVGRPTVFGDPFIVERYPGYATWHLFDSDVGPIVANFHFKDSALAAAVVVHRDWLRACSRDVRIVNRWLHETVHERLPLLRGHDLACWCPLDAPCHADVLLELANA